MSKLLSHPSARRRLIYTVVWAVLIASMWGGLWYVVFRVNLASASVQFLAYRSNIVSGNYALARTQMTPAWQARHSEDDLRRFFEGMKEKHGALRISPPVRITDHTPLRFEVYATFADGYTASIFYEIKRPQPQAHALISHSEGPDLGPW